MFLKVPRIDPTTHQGDRPSPSWWPVTKTPPGGAPQLVGVVLRCKCGHQAQLVHDVSRSGEVMPSVVCPAECGFHDVVELERWDFGLFKGQP